MPASYPGSIKTFTVKIDGVDYVMAAHVNEIQDEIVAIETALMGDLSSPDEVNPHRDVNGIARIISVRNEHAVSSGIGSKIVFFDLNYFEVGKITIQWDGSNWVLSLGTNDLDPTLIIKNGDVYTTPLTDYTDSATIVGWTSYAYKKIHYKVIGKSVFLQFYISGVSNSVMTNFSLPFANSPIITGGSISATDNGIPAGNAQASIPASASTMDFFTSLAGAGWTATGAKEIFGQIQYMKA